MTTEPHHPGPPSAPPTTNPSQPLVATAPPPPSPLGHRGRPPGAERAGKGETSHAAPHAASHAAPHAASHAAPHAAPHAASHAAPHAAPHPSLRHALATAPPRPSLPPALPTAPPRAPRTPARRAATAACAVLGLGLISGAAAGSWLAADDPQQPTAGTRFTDGRTAWRSVPVDTLFPRTLKGSGAGPGGADRAWTRVAVAPDSGCTHALDPLLLKALGPVGCARLLRATYTDATTSSVTTVGMVFTQADESATNALRTRFTREKLAERTDLMPRTFPVPGTVAAGFGDGQRASWSISVLKDVPVVVYAVSGFADGRTVTGPQPATPATADGATTAPAQSGLAHEAKGIADRIERGLRKNVNSATEQPG